MYLALYRKWRPKYFKDVISQEYIVTTLKNEIQSGHIGHAYLFTGSRGTGKTTCAKIFSKAVNCLHPVDGEPCLTCEICRGLEDGSILDVDEMDAASNNSVEDIRMLREEANYTPVSCKYRVYIIDEAHMLTSSAFNAFLKIMEEPPSHVIFILATTEAHKIPATILSRCQRFDFKRLKRQDIAKRLLEIAAQEEFVLAEDAASLIAKVADGAMRDALSILEQCVAISKEITLKSLVQTMGIPAKDQLFSISFALLHKDISQAIAVLDELYQGSKDFDRLCQELISIFRDVMIYQTSKTEELLFVNTPDEVDQVKTLALESRLDQVLSILTGLQAALDAMGKTQSKRLEMELCLIRLCADSPGSEQTPSLDERKNLPSHPDDMLMQKKAAKTKTEEPKEIPPFAAQAKKDGGEIDIETQISLDSAQKSKPLEAADSEKDSYEITNEEQISLISTRNNEAFEAADFKGSPAEARILSNHSHETGIFEDVSLNQAASSKPDGVNEISAQQVVSRNSDNQEKPLPAGSSPVAQETENPKAVMSNSQTSMNPDLKEELFQNTDSMENQLQSQDVLDSVQGSKTSENTVLNEASDRKTDFKNQTAAQDLLKKETGDEENSLGMTLLPCWNQVLEELQENPSCAMIGGFLQDSQAFTMGDKLFIQSSVPLSAERVLAKRDILSQLIQKHTGQIFRFFIQSKKGDGKDSANESTNVELLLQRAEDAGILVENEG